MKNLYRITLIVCVFSQLSLLSGESAINPSGNDLNILPDTTEAYRYYHTGDSLLSKEQFDRAVHYLQEAILHYEQNQQISGVVKSYNKISAALFKKGNFELSINNAQKALAKNISTDRESKLEKARTYLFLAMGWQSLEEYDSAFTYYNDALNIMQKLLPNDHIDVGKCYRGIAENYRRMAKYDLAKDNYGKALKIFEQSKGASAKEHLANLLIDMGVYSSDLDHYDEAIHYYSRALEILTANYNKKNKSIGNIYNNMAGAYWYKSQYELAAELYKKAFDVWESVLGKDHYYLGILYSNISLTYSQNGQHDLALEYCKKGESIIINALGNNNRWLAHIYSQMAYDFLESKEYEKALEYNEKSLLIRRSLFGEINEDVATSYAVLGLIHEKQGHYKKSLLYHEKSIRINSEIFGLNHHTVSDAYTNIGSVLYKLKEYDSSLYYYKKALEVNSIAFGTDAPTLAVEHLHLGSVYLAQDNLDSALAHYQKSVRLNGAVIQTKTGEVTIDINSAFSSLDLLKALKNKGICLSRFYKKNKDLDFLKRSIVEFQYSDTIVDQMRQSYLNYNDKKDLGATASEIYQNAIEVNLKLYEKTRDQLYLNSAFHFLERSKAGVLLESLGELSAKQILPDSLLKKERMIKIDKNFYQSEILQLKAQHEDFDPAKHKYYEDKLFHLNRKQDTLNAFFEANFPQYYQLKYKNEAITVDELQRSLADKTVVLEFLEGDDKIYAFVITNKHFSVSVIEDAEDVRNSVKQLREISNTAHLVSRANDSYKTFVDASFNLYVKLIHNSMDKIAEKDRIENMIIIPDGDLSYIPFDLLLTNKSAVPTRDYGTLDYLIKSYSISYSYSASFNSKRRKYAGSRAKESYIGYAPAYDKRDKDQDKLLVTDKLRNAIIPLKWNQKEIEEASYYFKGDKRLNINATESSFKNDVNNYGIIHLAMHAFIDDEDPMLSRLIFSQNAKDSLNDGLLHAYELFNMEMSPELVVLSACNTGYGKLQKGEGVMSLAYSFAYAGSPSLIVSQWQVDDESTSELIQFFYAHLKNGEAKDEALRNAKLDFLTTANPIKKHPFYWAGFVVIGDTSPITDRQHSLLLLIPIIILIFAAGLWVSNSVLCERNNKIGAIWGLGAYGASKNKI